MTANFDQQPSWRAKMLEALSTAPAMARNVPTVSEIEALLEVQGLEVLLSVLKRLGCCEGIALCYHNLGI